MEDQQRIHGHVMGQYEMLTTVWLGLGSYVGSTVLKSFLNSWRARCHWMWCCGEAFLDGSKVDWFFKPLGSGWSYTVWSTGTRSSSLLGLNWWKCDNLFFSVCRAVGCH